MVIESKEISKEYVEEYVNTILSGSKLRRDHNYKIPNLFEKLTFWMISSAFWLVMILGYMGFNVIQIFTTDFKPTTFLTVVYIGVIVILFVLLSLVVKNARLLHSMKLTRKTLLSEERNVTYAFDEYSFEFDNPGQMNVKVGWDDIEFIMVRKFGSYVVCKNNGDKLSMIGVPSDEAKELLEFVKEKKPETVIIRG